MCPNICKSRNLNHGFWGTFIKGRDYFPTFHKWSDPASEMLPSYESTKGVLLILSSRFSLSPSFKSDYSGQSCYSNRLSHKITQSGRSYRVSFFHVQRIPIQILGKFIHVVSVPVSLKSCRELSRNLRNPNCPRVRISLRKKGLSAMLLTPFLKMKASGWRTLQSLLPDMQELKKKPRFLCKSPPAFYHGFWGFIFWRRLPYMADPNSGVCWQKIWKKNSPNDENLTNKNLRILTIRSLEMSPTIRSAFNGFQKNPIEFSWPICWRECMSASHLESIHICRYVYIYIHMCRILPAGSIGRSLIRNETTKKLPENNLFCRQI